MISTPVPQHGAAVAYHAAPQRSDASNRAHDGRAGDRDIHAWQRVFCLGCRDGATEGTAEVQWYCS